MLTDVNKRVESQNYAQLASNFKVDLEIGAKRPINEKLKNLVAKDVLIDRHYMPFDSGVHPVNRKDEFKAQFDTANS